MVGWLVVGGLCYFFMIMTFSTYGNIMRGMKYRYVYWLCPHCEQETKIDQETGWWRSIHDSSLFATTIIYLVMGTFAFTKAIGGF